MNDPRIPDIIERHGRALTHGGSLVAVTRAVRACRPVARDLKVDVLQVIDHVQTEYRRLHG